MLRFESLALHNFKTFRGTHQLDLPQRGLVRVDGNNMANTDLGSNGVGKSTIADALTWCLYGKTPAGSNGKDLLPWVDGGAAQESDLWVECSINGRVLKRTWNASRVPNSLTLEGEEVDQLSLIEGTLSGLCFPAFLHTVVHPQYGNTFMRMTASQRASLLSQCVQLDVWLSYSKQASDRRPALRDALERINTAMAKTMGHVETLQEKLELEKTFLGKWRKKREAELKKLRRDWKKLDDRVGSLDKQIASLGADIAAHRSKAEKWVRIRDQRKSALEVADEYKRQATDTVVGHKERLSIATENLVRTSRLLESKTCPTCGQLIEDKSFASTLNDERQKKRHQAELLEIAKKKLKAAQTKYDRVSETYKRADSFARKYQHKLEGAERDKQAAMSERANALLDQSKTMAAIEKLEAEEAPYGGDYKKTEARIENKRHSLRYSMRRERTLQEELAALDLWAKGFKEVRGLVIDKVISLFEYEAANVLALLGMDDWQIELSVSDKVKGVTSGLDLKVFPVDKAGTFNIQSLSGGESTRIELAVEMALSNLIQDHLGTHTSLEIWDEPSTYLSHVAPIVDVLTTRVVDRGCALLYIDHRGLEGMRFDSVISVIKEDPFGSYFR